MMRRETDKDIFGRCRQWKISPSFHAVKKNYIYRIPYDLITIEICGAYSRVSIAYLMRAA